MTKLLYKNPPPKHIQFNLSKECIIWPCCFRSSNIVLDGVSGRRKKGNIKMVMALTRVRVQPLLGWLVCCTCSFIPSTSWNMEMVMDLGSHSRFLLLICLWIQWIVLWFILNTIGINYDVLQGSIFIFFPLALF